MRIWLPDAPGVLGAVAAEIGAVQGQRRSVSRCSSARRVWPSTNSWWSCPTRPARSMPCAAGCATCPASGVEEVTELARRGDPTGRTRSWLPPPPSWPPPHPTAALAALTGRLVALFDLSWLAVADEEWRGFVEVHGEDVPSVQWVAAFAEGSRSGADPANDTTGSGVFVEPVPEAGLTVCGGRPVGHPAQGAPRDRHAGDGGGPLRPGSGSGAGPGAL